MKISATKRNSKNLSCDYNSGLKESFPKASFRHKFSSIINQKDLDFLNIKSILEKLPGTRNEKELKILSKFLESTELIEILKNSNPEDLYNEVAITKTLTFLSSQIIYQFAHINEVIIKEGDIAEDFYVILRGSAQVIKLKEISKRITIADYIMRMNIIEKEDECLFHKIYEINKGNILISKNYFQGICEYINLVKFRKIILSEKVNNYQELLNAIDSRFSKKNFKFLEYLNLNKNEIFEYDEFLELKRKIFDKIKSNIEVVSVKHIEMLSEEKIVKMYEKQAIIKLEAGKYFGDFAFNKKNRKRTATIVACENLYLGKISTIIYEKYLKGLKQKHFQDQINFFVEKCFFYQIKQELFIDKYFNYFFLLEKTLGDKIYQENSNYENIYFIKEGKIDISINISLQHMIELISHYQKLTGYEQSKNYIDISKLQWLSAGKYSKEYTKIRAFKIFQFNSNQILGLEEYFFKLDKMIYTTSVTSTKTTYFSIPYEKFDLMMSNEFQAKNFLQENTKNRINALLKRLDELKDFTLKSIENEIKFFGRKNKSIPNYHERSSSLKKFEIFKNHYMESNDLLKIQTSTLSSIKNGLDNENLNGSTIKKNDFISTLSNINLTPPLSIDSDRIRTERVKDKNISDKIKNEREIKIWSNSLNFHKIKGHKKLKPKELNSNMDSNLNVRDSILSFKEVNKVGSPKILKDNNLDKKQYLIIQKINSLDSDSKNEFYIKTETNVNERIQNINQSIIVTVSPDTSHNHLNESKSLINKYPLKTFSFKLNSIIKKSSNSSEKTFIKKVKCLKQLKIKKKSRDVNIDMTITSLRKNKPIDHID